MTKEEIAEKKRLYYAEHREEIAEKMRRYYAKHREEIAEKMRQYRAEHRDEIAEQKRRYMIMRQKCKGFARMFLLRMAVFKNQIGK